MMALKKLSEMCNSFLGLDETPEEYRARKAAEAKGTVLDDELDALLSEADETDDGDWETADDFADDPDLLDELDADAEGVDSDDYLKDEIEVDAQEKGQLEDEGFEIPDSCVKKPEPTSKAPEEEDPKPAPKPAGPANLILMDGKTPIMPMGIEVMFIRKEGEDPVPWPDIVMAARDPKDPGTWTYARAVAFFRYELLDGSVQYLPCVKSIEQNLGTLYLNRLVPEFASYVKNAAREQKEKEEAEAKKVKFDPDTLSVAEILELREAGLEPWEITPEEYGEYLEQKKAAEEKAKAEAEKLSLKADPKTPAKKALAKSNPTKKAPAKKAPAKNTTTAKKPAPKKPAPKKDEPYEDDPGMRELVDSLKQSSAKK